MKLNDAINRSALEKLKREKDALERKHWELNQEKNKVKKAWNLDANYLIKQEEYMADLKIAMKLGDGNIITRLYKWFRKYKLEIKKLKLRAKEKGC